MNTPDSDCRVCDLCGAPLGRYLEDGLCSRCLARFTLLEAEEGPQSAPDPAHENQVSDKAYGPFHNARFGDYELLEEIARGGMGVVYRARQISLNRIVAIKTLLFGQLAGKAAFDRFRAEAETVAHLQHPNIVGIHEIGEADGQPYFSMDYVAGRSLADIVKHHPLPARLAAVYVRKIAQAVHYAHTQGVLHRDLKPANVLIDEADEPRITDFGIARRLTGDSELTITGQVVGSPNFMPPEQGAGSKAKLGPTADVYGLGALLYYLLTARPPFVAETFEATLTQVLNIEPVAPRQLNPGLPLDLETICLKCLEKDPARRYASAGELADELERFLKGEPTRARPVGVIGKGWRWCRRKPAVAGMAGVALITVLLVSSVAVWRVESARRQESLERYAANISLADNWIREGSIDLAVNYLLKCPEEFRHWEWGRLLFECLQEVSSIPAHTNRPQFLHRQFIESFALIGNGSRLWSRGGDGSLAVWDPLEGRELFRVGDPVNRVTACGAHGIRGEIAVAKLDGSLEILDTDSGRVVTRLIAPLPIPTNRPPDPIIDINLDTYDLSPIRNHMHGRGQVVDFLRWRGDRLLVKFSSGQLILRDFAPEAREWTWPQTGGQRVARAWFTPDDTAVAVQTANEVQMLDLATGTTLNTMRWNAADGQVTVSPTCDRVVQIDPEGRATLRGPQGLVSDLGRLVKRNDNAPLSAFFSADGSVFCTTGDVGTARVFRSSTGDEIFALPYSVYGGEFTYSGDQLTIFGLDRIVHIWDVSHRLEVRQLRGHLSSITRVHFARDSKLIASASREGVVKIWSGQNQGRVLCGETLTTSSGISRDGKWLATAPSWRGLRLWEADTGRLKWKLPVRTYTAFTMAFSPDSQLLYAAGSDRCVRIFHVADGTSAGMLRGQHPAWGLHCSADGQYVATGDLGGWVKLWDPSSRAEKRSFKAYPRFVSTVFFDPAGRRLVTAGNGRPKVWEVATGRLIAELDDQGIGVWGAVFAPDGQHVVAACMDQQIRIWEVASGRLVASWTSQAQGAASVSHSPDGLRFAVVGTDMGTLGVSLPTLEIWDAQHGRALLNLKGHRESMYAALFDSTGRKLVTSSMDTTVRQWEAFPWENDDYADLQGATFEDKVRNYARNYWRRQLAQTNNTAELWPEAESMPPGIPAWERERWPIRDASAQPNQINLDKAYTGVLDAVFYPSWNENEWEDDLSGLPVGCQEFGGVRFDVRGVVWLRSESAAFLRSTYSATCRDFPGRVQGIEVRSKFRKMHVIHAATRVEGWQRPPPGNTSTNPLPIGAYVLQYADGTQHEFDIRYGRDLLHWWWGNRGDPEAEPERGKVVWAGTNAVSARYEAKVRVFMSTFENPRPEVEVVSVDFVSKNTHFAPFLVAMTVEP